MPTKLLYQAFCVNFKSFKQQRNTPAQMRGAERDASLGSPACILVVLLYSSPPPTLTSRCLIGILCLVAWLCASGLSSASCCPFRFRILPRALRTVVPCFFSSSELFISSSVFRCLNLPKCSMVSGWLWNILPKEWRENLEVTVITLEISGYHRVSSDSYSCCCLFWVFPLKWCHHACDAGPHHIPTPNSPTSCKAQFGSLL